MFDQIEPFSFPLTGARFVEPLGRWTPSAVASLLPDRLAIGKQNCFNLIEHCSKQDA